MFPVVLSLLLAASPGPSRQPARLALFFSPLSLGSLSLWIEADVALVKGLDLSANVGGGALGQFGGDLGLRYYVQGTSLDGFYFDARATLFSLPAQQLWLVGPGLMIGYGLRWQRLALSFALGVTTWYAVSRSQTGAGVLAGGLTDSDVIFLPGLSQPFADRPAVQPTLRVSLGPWF